jgi:hypothetical protein
LDKDWSEDIRAGGWVWKVVKGCRSIVCTPQSNISIQIEILVWARKIDYGKVCWDWHYGAILITGNEKKITMEMNGWGKGKERSIRNVESWVQERSI